MKKILLVISILVLISALAFAQSEPVIKWKFTAKEGINSIYVGDLENDGNIEIVVAASIDGMVYVVDSRGAVKWKYNLYCPVSMVYAADLDNDGKQEVMAGSCRYLTIIDSNGTKKGQILSWNGIRDIYASDIDNDNFKEIISTISSSPYSNGVGVIDKNGKKRWSYNMEEKPFSVYASDIDNDNKKEVIVGAAEKEERFFKSGHVYVLNSTGGLLWNFKTNTGINHVSASDIDNDGSEEILVGSYQRFYLLDKNGNMRWNYTTGGYIYKVEVADIDKDGNNELIVGSNDLYIFDKNGNLKWKDKVGTEVYDIFIDDIDNNGNLEIIVGSDRVYIFDSKGNLDWKSDDYLAVRGIYIADLDNDKFKEIIAGTLNKNLYVFEIVNYAKTKLAHSYYERAQNFYTSRNYENASKYAQMAKSIYSEINNNDGISKSELLISQIEKLSEKVGKDREDADAFYKKAEDFYFSGEYLNASAYARMAMNKYTSIGDSEGISKSNSLIENINTGLKADASEYYANATNRYNSKDYNGAISDAKKARAIYEEIKDSDDVLKTNLLIADVYFKLAQKKYESNNLTEALKYAQNAKVIYICIESKCDFKNIENISIQSLANISYNESPYRDELMQIDALIRSASIKKKETVEFNITDNTKIIILIIIAVVILYFLMNVVRKNIEVKKTKNFPKKIIKDRFKRIGLPVRVKRV